MRLFPQKVSTASIANVDSLCQALSIPRSVLDQVLALGLDERYKEVMHIKKADGTNRPIYNPHHLLRRIQKKINERIFSDTKIIKWPGFLYGSIPNQTGSSGQDVSKDYVACAAVHCGAKSLLKIDVESFFDNIQRDIVLNIFSKFLKYPEDVADVLTNICCYKGRLVQGALTSSYIASLCLWDVEGNVVRRLNLKGLRYTRLVDDITVSSVGLATDFSYAKKLVEDMLSDRDLPIKASKTKVYRMSSEPLTVHSLRVNFSSPRLPADEVGRIRAAVKHVERLASEPNYITTHSYRKVYNRCVGRVNKLSRVGHNQHKILLARLNKIKPLPSFSDIRRAKAMLARLKSDFGSKGHTHWYRSRYYRLDQRLRILSRRYERTSDQIREEIRGIKPFKKHSSETH
ncbi:reverse transcriptase family protein [Pseudomonas sp. MYb185]|uniref:reverse transcriptase family protein n=1 Tax=Pseudomonas sp. MYb185 TaxID=1848729 RepID=UPI001C4859B1|nr:reverse transcriptase family protein [Pseudomonas sp. MYb185]